MTDLRNIFVFVRSPAWNVHLRRRFPNAHLVWALDIDALLSEVARAESGVAIIELTEDSIIQDCLKVGMASREPGKRRFFAVSGETLQPWRPLIETAGFSELFDRFSQIARLETMVHRHFQSVPASPDTIEDTIQNSLPWNPVPWNPVPWNPVHRTPGN